MLKREINTTCNKVRRITLLKSLENKKIENDFLPSDPTLLLGQSHKMSVK